MAGRCSYPRASSTQATRPSSCSSRCGRRRKGRVLPCRAIGPFMHITAEGKLVFHLQHAGDDVDTKCDEFEIIADVSKLKGKWLDFVMHAKWTGDKDGFLKFWVKEHDNHYAQKIGYVGRTWWERRRPRPLLQNGRLHRRSAVGRPGEHHALHRRISPRRCRLEFRRGRSARPRSARHRGGQGPRALRALSQRAQPAGNSDHGLHAAGLRSARHEAPTPSSTISTAPAAAAPRASGTGSTRRSRARWTPPRSSP